jgi:hypothetical protein
MLMELRHLTDTAFAADLCTISQRDKTRAVPENPVRSG